MWQNCGGQHKGHLCLLHWNPHWDHGRLIILKSWLWGKSAILQSGQGGLYSKLAQLVAYTCITNSHAPHGQRHKNSMAQRSGLIFGKSMRLWLIWGTFLSLASLYGFGESEQLEIIGKPLRLWWIRTALVNPYGFGESVRLWWIRTTLVNPYDFGESVRLWWIPAALMHANHKFTQLCEHSRQNPWGSQKQVREIFRTKQWVKKCIDQFWKLLGELHLEYWIGPHSERFLHMHIDHHGNPTMTQSHLSKILQIEPPNQKKVRRLFGSYGLKDSNYVFT